MPPCSMPGVRLRADSEPVDHMLQYHANLIPSE